MLVQQATRPPAKINGFTSTNTVFHTMSTSRHTISSRSTAYAADRKKRSLSEFIPAQSVHPRASSSAYAGRAYHNLSGTGSRRSPSPPASTYFPLLSTDATARLRPTPDAGAHFAYSTTLRRHPAEATSPTRIAQAVEAEAANMWSRVVTAVTGDESNIDNSSRYEPLPPAEPRQETNGDTVSSKFCRVSVDDTLAHFQTTLNGLSPSAVPALLSQYGYNEFTVETPESVVIKFLKTIYENPLIILLCGSATVSAVMGNVDDAVSIAVAILLVLLVGFVQERRSEKSLEALNKLVPHHCHVLRDGVQHHTLANELVPGDIVHLSTGDRVPADIRILSAVDLEIDESSLTGETEGRRKAVEACGTSLSIDDNGKPELKYGDNESIPLAERHCIGYMGTLVRSGRGSGVVIATGTETEFGVIFSMMQDVQERRTPLQLSMDELAKKLSMISFGVIGVIVLIGVLQKRELLDMFTIGVSLAVAAIPEGLPIVTTVTLALGVLRMADRKAIVKKLHSVEALGSVSVICSDKTGTLTKNEQTVTEAYAVDERVLLDPNTPTPSVRTYSQLSYALQKTLDIGTICNNAVVHSGADDGSGEVPEWEARGHSTDVALLNVMHRLGGIDKRHSFSRRSEKPFSSEHKYMAVSGAHTITSVSGGNTPTPEMYYVKGSIEAILDKCRFYYVSDDSIPALEPTIRQTIQNKAKSTAARGLRVIAMAYGHPTVNPSAFGLSSSTPNSSTISLYPNSSNSSTAHSSRAPSPSPSTDSTFEKMNLVFVGFVAMLDPPRKGVADSIALLHRAGVQVVMITGDAEETAMFIARDLGLKVGSRRHHDPYQHQHQHQRNGSAISRVSVTEPLMGLGDADASQRAYCLTGKEIDRMSKQQLVERVGSVSVFARTTPRHKMAIVEAFQARGAVVAMTGDGVNDAPALKMADIGVAMGKSGTDVAKEAADVILVDDNFTTILPAVEEGKSIFHNIQNFLAFQLSTATAALTLITLSTMLGLSNPLNAMQILFINILMDGPPSQSLGVDPVDPSIMRRPPRRKNAPIINLALLYRVLFSASIIVCGTLFVYLFSMTDAHISKREQTMTFTAFVFLDLTSAIQNRGLGCGLTQNRYLLTTVSISFIAQISLIYIPMMQSVFQTEALSMNDLSLLVGLAGGSFILHEVRRRYERRKLASDESWREVEELA
ncbi:calcium-transporting ATPase [Pluteus cervinus]|uniref:Calcium-transporting ATPase n=1 Tax=Pluteus cervinus TaxID=181527 RepID=A0ACD3AIL7_9AGAR|nr:calcium-transporting ATPase [Pluteus cervinus]